MKYYLLNKKYKQIDFAVIQSNPFELYLQFDYDIKYTIFNLINFEGIVYKKTTLTKPNSFYKEHKNNYETRTNYGLYFDLVLLGFRISIRICPITFKKNNE